MKRTCLLSTAALLATFATSSVALADTKPAIVWIPTADVEAFPSGDPDSICLKTGMNGTAVAAGCLANIAEATTLSPSPEAQDIAAGIEAAFAAYDLHVVTEAPPEYMPTYALFTGGEASEDNDSYSCTSQVSNCSALRRDAAYFAFLGGTNTCSDPDVVAAANFAVGLLAGLEGKEEAPDDWMNYPPDFMSPPTQFLDECGAIAAPLGGKDGMTPQPADCSSLDHVDCDSMEQNSHADLMENLGANAADEDAPVINLMGIADGDVIAEGDPLNVSFTMDEASNFAGTRLTISSEALNGVEGIVDGRISYCTTALCDRNFLEGEPFKPADSVWSSNDVNGLPGGDYTITIEASDYYGNEAEMITLNVTLEGGPIDPTESGSGGADDTGSAESNGSDPSAGDSMDTFASQGDESGGGSDTDGSAGGSGSSDDGGGGGCSVSAEQGVGGSFALMLGLFGLGLVRRRR